MNSDSSGDSDVREGDDCREFHVIGIGASAGGLEAIEDLFKTMPLDTGMAFVIVQHLSPDFKSHMEELLARHTRLPIHRVENGMEVEPDSIYLIPPKMEMVISGGRLLLTEKSADRTLSHPIDQFFRSLANDVGRYAIGIVLSGTGSDGSRGIRDIHDVGGMVVAQDEHSAKFDGMPLNAQATGVVHLVLPPHAVSEALTKYVKDGISPDQLAEHDLISTAAEGLEKIFQMLHQQHGLDFSNYKASTVGRRIQRRIDLLSLGSLDEYIEHIEAENSGELNDLYKDLLIGVTRFFRDMQAFEVLEKQVIPKMFSRPGRDHQPIRIWVAGCASGEEAYSIAILVDEELRRRKLSTEVKIFATDAHHVSLHSAARGVFNEESLAELTEERRSRYFRKKRDGYHVARELRRYIIFAPHNVVSDAPFTQMDLVSCRNLLIYLQPTAQRKVVSLFHFALKSGGTLFLGPSETPGEWSDEFQVIDKRWRVYTKRRDVRLPLENPLPLGMRTDRPKTALTPPAAPTPRIDQSLLGTYDRLLDRKMPPSVLVNESYEILHVFGGAERYIQPRGGRPTNNLLDVIGEQLKTPLTGALQHAIRKQDIVRYTGIQVSIGEANETLQISVEPIPDPNTKVVNLLVEIESLRTGSEAAVPETTVDVNQLTRDRIAGLESELRFSQENLQATIEEMETSNEELQATNEELVASNEELQSTNEELNSVNEELYTVNAEHQRRVEELTQANNDMDNLLATTRVGVIFLDDELFIRRFTPEIGRLFHLVPQDIGRSIEGFAHHLVYEHLTDDLAEVFREQREKEVQIRDRNGSRFLLRMLPYRSGDSVQGVVMTLIDIGSLHQARAELRRFKFMSESATDFHALINGDGQFVYVNAAFCEALRFSKDELQARTVMDVDRLYDQGRFRDIFKRAATARLTPFESELTASDGTIVPVEIGVSSVSFDGEQFLFATLRDIAERRRIEHEMRLQRLAIESTLNGVLIADAQTDDRPITYANPGFYQLTGYSRDEIIGKNCRFLQGEDTDSAAVDSLRSAIESGSPCRVTLLNYRKDGTRFWNDLQITPVRDEHNRLTNFVGVQNDVTEQVELEVSTRRTAERFQAILDTAAEGIYGLDRDGKCIFCNRAAVALLGYESEKQLVGQHMHNLIHHSTADGDKVPEQECRIYRAVRESAPVHADDEVFWRRDGDCFPVEYWCQPLVRDGELRGAVVTFQDISERLRLASRLESMGKMVDASHDAIIVWSLGGNIVSWNHGATLMYGYRAEEAIGRQTHTLLSTKHPISWDDIYEALVETGQWVGVLEQTTQSGEQITVSTRHHLLKPPGGELQVLEINRDITEQRRVQEELEVARQAAQDANEAKSAFLANMSHELRTPMTAVLGFAEILKSELEDGDLVESVDTIKRNGEYLLALLNDILDLSKIEAGRMDVGHESVDIRRIIADVRSLMVVRAMEEGIPLYFDWNSQIPVQVTADRVRLRQILVNLIGNALKFTDEGEVRVGIQLRRSQNKSRLEICVSDTGIGMTESQQRELFTPFSQASPETARRFGGTGLGLSISQRLADAMGGTIAVESEVGTGSRFTLSLPLSVEQMESLVTVSKDEPDLLERDSDNVELPSIDAKILLADDRRDVWRVVKYFLDKCGARVTIAEDGRQAVDAAVKAEKEGEPFAIILMDMQMPVMTGREAVQELRRQGSSVPIVALTADAMEGDREECLEFGCDEFISKPIDGSKLVHVVASLLRDRGSASDGSGKGS